MATAQASRLPSWVAALGPLLLIAVVLGGFVVLNPIGSLREVPPVEAVAFERVELSRGMVEMTVRNDGPDQVTIAQVLVNDAYWNFSIDDDRLDRLESTKIEIPYPWDEGLPLNIALVTSTGLTIEHEIEAAVETPEADARTTGIYALLGIYIGLLPVLIGLLWFPALARASKKWLGFFLAFTVGLLVFLLVDTIAEGLELAAATGGALNGLGLFGTGALAAVVSLLVLERFLSGRQAAGLSGLSLAYLIAVGIGLHNMGEGLAVGAALAAGEFALGTFLIIGFALHNTTEGLAIVAPIGRESTRPSVWHFVALGAVAGIPTVGGALAGGYAFSAAAAAAAFGVAAGAIAQVSWTILKSLPEEGRLSTAFGGAGFILGLVVMYVTGLFTA